MSQWSELSSIVFAHLWDAARSAYPNYRRGRYDCWILCPRAHALRHNLRCIIEKPMSAWTLDDAKVLLAQLQRFFPGDDLVFAVGDVQ